MKATSQDQLFYRVQQEALNYPRKYIMQLHRNRDEYPQLSVLSHEYFKAIAMLNTGEYRKGTAVLEEIITSLLAEPDDFLLSKCYLALHKILDFTKWDDSTALDYLGKARKIADRSTSKALRCELMLQDVQLLDPCYPVSHKEDMLQEAIHDAMESDVSELQLDTYIVYATVYLNHNLPEHANKYLAMLQDIITLEDNPYFYTQMHSKMGIISLMLKDLAKATEHLNTALTTARDLDYQHLLLPTLINYGILHKSLNDIDGALLIYRECLDLIMNSEIEGSINAAKVMDNYSLTLGLAGRSEDAIAIMRSSLALSRKLGDPHREHMLNINLADVLIEIREFTEAQTLLDSAIAFYTEQNNNQYLINAYRCRARLYEAMGQINAAFDTMVMLDQSHQKHFQDNFARRTARYQEYINKLQLDYLRIRNRSDDERQGSISVPHSEFIGEHPLIQKALSDAMRAARYPYANVFISGESGTGKEIIARIIHAESRINKPMVAINAAAISPHLIESELFGHKKGAFTGAISDAKGKFLLADQGTLLLDEISEMPIEQQAKLLRAIETQTIRPVGSDKEIRVRCRIISTSNCNLADLIHKNRFRLDLFHRLNKLEIHIPPLRERGSDLKLLVHAFTKRFAKDFGMPEPVITGEFHEALRQYRFPGNVRELLNIIERIFILKPRPIWDADQLTGLIDLNPFDKSHSESFFQNVRQTEYQIILEALQKSNWIQKDAARMLNMTESTLSRRIKRLNIVKHPSANIQRLH